MADLYRLADRVLVWLGPGKKDTRYGLRILRELSSKVTVNWDLITMKPTSKSVDEHWADESKELPYGDKELFTIYSLISCPWFERLWIWQEIRLASSTAILICGSDTIPWESFRTALFCLHQKAYPTELSGVIAEPFFSRVLKTYHLADSKWNFSFMCMMYFTRHCKYSDPKDRVYAVLSLLESSGEAVDIEPDYTKRTGQVYQDLTLGYINQRKRLEILSLSRLNKRLSDMPTWVPDLTVVDYPFLLTYGLASGLSNSEVQYRGAGILEVTGSVLATVQHANRVDTRGPKGLIAEIQRLAPHDVLQGSYIGSCSLFTAFCNTICANEFSDRYVPHHEYLPDFQQSLDILSAIVQPGMKEVPDYRPGTHADKFLRIVGSYLTGRSLFKTHEGHICLGPPYAQPGDQVCILLGCRFPMQLRPTSTSQYQVVGECYVHGLMNGEAFLCPLPEYLRSIRIFDARKRQDLWGFLDYRTGKTQYNDPRVDSLPADDNDKGTPMIYYPDGTQTRKLTPEMIETRGVKLQTFDLI